MIKVIKIEPKLLSLRITDIELNATIMNLKNVKYIL